MVLRILFLLVIISSPKLFSQEEWKEAEVITCHFSEENAFTQVFNETIERNSRVEATSSIEITYNGDIPTNAKTAVEYAKGIWEKYLSSTQIIRIKVVWQSLSGSTLAQTSTNRIYRNFTNAPQQNVWYPVALAEALSGKDLNAGDFEITVTLNSGISWYYGTDAKVQAGRYDLATVVLHEIAHGVGFTSSFELTSNSTQAQYGQSSSPYVYDTFIQNSSKQKLTNAAIFGNPSIELKNAVTSNALYFGLKNPSLQSALPRLYAPTTYRDGSSLSHFDESVYPSGTANALLSPNVRAAEANHNLGNLLLNCLNEMGWQLSGFDGYVVTANEEENLSGVIIYPNPVNDVLNVVIPYRNQSRDVILQIVGGNGQILKNLEKKQIQESEINWDLSDLPEGFYFLRVNDASTKTTKKIIKQ